MRNIILLSIILLVGCFSNQKAVKSTVLTVKDVPESYSTVATTSSKTLQKLAADNSIEYNNTRIRILLDELENGVPFDTTILRGNTVTSYSFTPQINTWDKTDTCYSARYFLTIDVRQEIAPNAKEILKKKVSELDREIEKENEMLQRKIKARNDAQKLSKN